MRVFCSIVLILGLAAPVRAHDFSRDVLWAGHVVDLTTTEIFLHRGYREGNPLLQNRASRIAISTGSTLLVDRLTKRMPPKVAKAVNFAFGGGRIAIGLTWNLRK